MLRAVRWALTCSPLVVLGAGADVQSASTPPAPTPAATAPTPPAHPHWSYSGEESPQHWGDIAPTCSRGQLQSPIGFNSRGAITKGPFPKMTLEWHQVTGEAVDNGHTIQVNVPPGNFLTLGDARYEMKQFHFHSPSEHNVNGEHTAMEVHFVHQSADGKLAVLGVLLKTGKTSAALEPVLGALPPKDGIPKKVEIDLTALVPKDRTHFSYAGSLTTPPCTEGVQWLVVVAQPEVGKAQVDAFHARYPANARPTQAWHGRKISIAP